MPKKRILFFTKILSPDLAHMHKNFGGENWYKRFSHMNTKTIKGSIKKAKREHKLLRKNLKNQRGTAKNLAWVAHYIVDSLEPMHLIDWKRKIKPKQFRRHFYIENQTKNIEIRASENTEPENEKSLEKLLERESSKIRSRNLENLYPDGMSEILEIYKEEIIPLQLKITLQTWKEALLKPRAKQ
ncbi:hypothetical protein GF360_00400 [candidate division WWE3 bacterium]|nr:hypothetical protein [candidate division WWE3 bacterium]